MSRTSRRPARCTRVVVRSPHAHARFRIADVAAARAMPGVHLVLTAADIAELGELPCVAVPEGVTVKAPSYPVLARDEVRHVGDAVAFMVAETIEQAKDAAEAIAIEWQPCPMWCRRVDALKPGRAAGVAGPSGNVAFETTLGDEQATARAFAGAAHTVSLTIVNQRLVTNFLDTRAVVAEYDAAGGPPHPDARQPGLAPFARPAEPGGAQDSARKAARRHARCRRRFRHQAVSLSRICAGGCRGQSVARPVKWVAERTEHFLGDTQGRDNDTTARLALDAENRFTALSIDMVCDMGAYLSAFAPYIPYVGAVMLPGVYDFPACFIRITAAFTNTVPVDAYRGAGRPEAAYLIERLVDVAARDLGIAPEALRRKNFIKPKAMPYTTPTGKVYDSGEFAGHMARAQEIIDWKGFGHRAAQSQARPASCAASGWRPISRLAAATARMPRRCGSSATATSRCWRDRNRPDRATRPPMPSSSPSISTCRRSGSP